MADKNEKNVIEVVNMKRAKGKNKKYYNAVCSVTVNGVTINSVFVKTYKDKRTKENKLFVTFPQREYTSNGETCYSNLVFFGDELYKEVCDFVLEAYDFSEGE